MKKTLLTFALIICAVLAGTAQGVVGKWKTIDDETGKAKSVVEIYEENGKIYGKVIEILDPTKQDATCRDCPDDAKGKRILGLVILKGLKKDGDEYSGGTILDPSNGKVYKSLIALEEPNKLKVRGYVGFSLLGRSQYWIRVK